MMQIPAVCSTSHTRKR